MEEAQLLIFSLAVFLVAAARNIYFPNPTNDSEISLSSRDYFFDWLKGIAIFAVIVIHVSYFYNFFFEPHSQFFNIINNLSRFTIPIFFICSGILLKPIANRNGLKKFYGKKIIRIFLPYIIVVSILAILADKNLKDFLYLLITGNASVPYYFVIVLLQFYILYPLLSLGRNSKLFLYISFLISLSSFLYPLSWRLFGAPLFFKFLFFFQYGIYKRNYFLNYQKKDTQKELWFWLSIIIFYLLLIFVFDYRFYNVRLFYGLAIFNLLFMFRDKIKIQNWMSKIIIKAGQLSLWIFLLHFFVVEFFFHRLNSYTHNIYSDFAIIFILSTIFSYLIAYLSDMIYKSILKIFK